MPRTTTPSPDRFVKKLAGDFDFFLRHLWLNINLPPPSWVQKRIARWLSDTTIIRIDPHLQEEPAPSPPVNAAGGVPATPPAQRTHGPV